MKNYNNWMTTNFNESEDIVFEMSPKTKVNINKSIQEYEAIINDANEWQKNVDEIILIKKDVFNIQFGDYISHDNKVYLIKHLVEDRDFFWSGKIQLCNNTLNIQTGTTKTQTDTDPMGRPIYEETPTYTNFDAIVKSKSYQSEHNEQINIPDNRLLITIQYNDLVKKGMDFKMYGSTYLINDIDYTNTINGKGIITLYADMQ